MRRWALTLVTGVASVVAVVALFAVSEPAPRIDDHIEGTDCRASTWVVLSAQAVPGAEWVPCLADPPDDWEVIGSEVRSGSATFELATADVGGALATVELRPGCAVPDDAEAVEPDPEDPVPITAAAVTSQDGRTEVTGWAPFDGGCLVVDLDVPERYDVARVLAELDASLDMAPRDAVAAEVAEATDGHLTLDPSP